MNFIKEKGYKILLIIMLVLWGFITYSTIFHIYPSNVHDTIKFSPLIILLGVGIIILFLLLIYKLISKVKEKKHDLIALILCIISFITVCIFALNYKTTFRYDLNHIEDIVQVLLNNKILVIRAMIFLMLAFAAYYAMPLCIAKALHIGDNITIIATINTAIIVNRFIVSFSLSSFIEHPPVDDIITYF